MTLDELNKALASAQSPGGGANPVLPRPLPPTLRLPPEGCPLDPWGRPLPECKKPQEPDPYPDILGMCLSKVIASGAEPGSPVFDQLLHYCISELGQKREQWYQEKREAEKQIQEERKRKRAKYEEMLERGSKIGSSSRRRFL